MATLDLDDDLTGQVKHALSEPISNPENAIRQQKVLTLLLASRIGRMERVAYWLVGTIVAAMRAEHERELTAMREQLAVEAQRYAQRFDALHERRNEDLREVLRESLDHMAATREAVGKITEAMGTLRDVLRRPA